MIISSENHTTPCFKAVNGHTTGGVRKQADVQGKPSMSFRLEQQKCQCDLKECLICIEPLGRLLIIRNKWLTMSLDPVPSRRHGSCKLA